MSSTWKNRLTLSLFGESHGTAVGVTLDGIPAGEVIDLEALQAFLDRRAPGLFPGSTPRKESDVPQFLSGIKDGKTTGTPITAILPNLNAHSADYDDFANIPRPGHADFTGHVKYGGHQDRRGGGHFSGRLTAPLCVAGGICLQLLARRGVAIGSHITELGGVADPPFDEMVAILNRTIQKQDSVGGIIECIAIGLPAGLGDPIFDGMENRIAGLVFGIPSVKGIEFGAGFGGAAMLGSEHNDAFYFDGDTVQTRTNHHGGILGGITTGMPLVFRTAIKPTPTLALSQESVNLRTGESAMIAVDGRHDTCITPRAMPCIEAAAAIAIYDAML
ncbi:MAG: chorismate synthase [Oscillospiraceae bacterium]|nr:chorismate synthase [Oscillospiraceae bacterium]